MTEMHCRRVRPPALIARHRDAQGVERGYLRYAVIGDAPRPLGRTGIADWPRELAGLLSGRNVLSPCHLARPGATAYDTRRVQLREAVAHRPHLVALNPGLADVDRRDWDGEVVRAHLLHCAMVLTQHDAIVMTVRSDPTQRGLDLLRPTHRRRRARIESINAVLTEIDRRYGGIHLEWRAGGRPTLWSGRGGEGGAGRWSDALRASGIPCVDH